MFDKNKGGKENVYSTKRWKPWESTHTHTHTHTSSIIKKYIIFSCPKIEDQVLM